MKKRTCIEDGCEKASRTRGLCSTHYARLYRATRTSPCTVEGCDGKVYALGWCSSHYRRARMYGDPEGEARRATVAERLASMSEPSGECLLWTGTRNDDGYGRVRVDGRMMSAHRIAWAESHGPIPGGAEIDHACHNRACINVAHLRLADRVRNVAYRAGANSNSATGVRGVYPAASAGRFVAQVGRQRLGTYSTVEGAAEAVSLARSERYGPFAGR